METSTLVKNLRAILAHNIVSFTYTKRDGTTRHARGTRNIALAEKAAGYFIPTPQTTNTNENAYFDLDKMGWRSFVPELVVSIDCVEDETAVIRVDYMRKEQKGETPKPTPTPTPKAEMPTDLGKEIRKAMTDLDKDIEIPIGKGVGFGMPIGGGIGTPIVKGEFGMGKPIGKSVAVPFGDGEGMVFTPLAVSKEHTTLPIGGMPIEDFAKLVAKYVVAELADRLTK